MRLSLQGKYKIHRAAMTVQWFLDGEPSFYRTGYWFYRWRNFNANWKPHPGPQKELMESPTQIKFYGGM